MKTRNGNAIVIINFIVIVVTIALFFVLTEKRVLIDWLGISFILAVELILMISLMFLESASGHQIAIMFQSGMYSTIGVYTVFSIAASLLFMFLFRDGAKYLIAIQIILLAIILIIIVLIYISSGHVGESTTATLSSINKMQELMNKVVILQNTYENKVVGTKLNMVYEAIRYCDVSTTVATDDIIATKLEELKLLLDSATKEKSETVEKLVVNILALIKQRNNEVSMMKAGGI